MPTRIGPLTGFALDTPTPVSINSGDYLVIRRSQSPDEVCVVRDRCPHAGLSLSRGPRGSYENGVITCPWHNSTFDVCSGENLDWTPGFAGHQRPLVVTAPHRHGESTGAVDRPHRDRPGRRGRRRRLEPPSPGSTLEGITAMAHVVFTVTRDLPLPAEAVFGELINWRGHANWVPLTRVTIVAGDGGPGTEFIATSGIGPLALPDRMRVDTLDRVAMTVGITKIGPVLTGAVRLSVTATGARSSRLVWVEDVSVPVVPQFLSTPVAAAARRGFETSITRMARRLGAR